MDIFTVIFLLVSFGSLIAGFVFEGGAVTALGSVSAAIIILGGTIGATGLSFPIAEIKRVPAMLKVFFIHKETDLVDLVLYFKEISFKTRKNGLLSLESEITENTSVDPFIKKGLQLAVDGIEPEALRSILELEVESTSERHRDGAAIFETAGGYAPTMGIIGTVMGLVHVLGNLSDTASLGPKIASAFIATLYGIGTANLVWLPIAARLKALDNKEFNEKRLIVEAVLYIQEGVNPNTISEKLKGFLNKEELAKFESKDGKVEV